MSFECCVGVMWVMCECGCHLDVVWVSFGCYMWVMCECGCHLNVVWVSCGLCVSVGVIWMLCGCHLDVTCGCHVGYV